MNRANTLYTVNIWKDGTLPSGYPLTIKGGAQPFTTDESDDDDPFIPIRTQSGYVRFFDDGYAMNSAATPQRVSFNWKEILPSTDTDRPVTLTTSSGTIVWQGFLQAQNFGGVLYGNPQVRELPVQCPLSVLGGVDINYNQRGIQNFAYILRRCLNNIDIFSGGAEDSDEIITTNGSIHIDNIYIEGSALAQSWLLKCIDWQNFATEDDNGLIARYSLFQCLEDMCRFWGWTARVCASAIYLSCADDSDAQTWLWLTRANLDTMAGGTAAGTIGLTFSTCTMTGDIFANTNNEDFKLRGNNKAVVTADINRGDDTVVNTDTDSMYRTLTNAGWQNIVTNANGSAYRYTNDIQSFDLPFLSGTAVSGYASFNYAMLYDKENDLTSQVKQIQIKQAYDSAHASVYATLEVKYEHCYSDNWLELHGEIFRKYTRADYTVENGTIGTKTMYVRIGIRRSGYPTLWLNGYNNWQNTNNAAKFRIGNKNDTLYLYDPTEGPVTFERFPLPQNASGTLFFEFLGSDDIPDVNNSKSFEIANFSVKMWHGDINEYNYQTARWWKFENTEDVKFTQVYSAKNNNKVHNEFNADCIFASENKTLYGYGLLINPIGSYMTGADYGGEDDEFPEQHLADRVVTYWATSKRKIQCELKGNMYVGSFIRDLTPRHKVTMDGSTLYPIAISHDWRDDITKLTLIEI